MRFRLWIHSQGLVWSSVPLTAYNCGIGMKKNTKTEGNNDVMCETGQGREWNKLNSSQVSPLNNNAAS
jgi:hypothetical protein